jgi:hypothetical protein
MTDPATRALPEPPEVARYCDALLLALRMAEVPGPRIGEVLSEVRGHLADSGEDPVEAFGPPEEYAAALAGARAPRTRRERLREGLTGASFALGGWWLADGATALATGEPTRVGPMPLVAAALAAVGGSWALEQVVSSSRARMVRGVLVIALALTALTGLGLLLGDRAAVRTPAVVVLALGLLCLAAGALTLRNTADPVVDPFQSDEATRAVRRRSELLLGIALWGGLLVLVALAVGVGVLAERLG